MATPNLLSKSTWRILGLSVAAGYTGLGLLDVFAPRAAANLLGIWPKRPGTSPQAQELIETSAVLIGARDISIGVALFAFDYYRMPRSMGILTLSGMVLCVVDVVWVYHANGPASGIGMGVGAAIWGWIGLNLLEL